MNDQQVAEKFNEVIANETDKERIAKLELLREYFTNSEFRQALHDEVWSKQEA